MSRVILLLAVLLVSSAGCWTRHDAEERPLTTALPDPDPGPLTTDGDEAARAQYGYLYQVGIEDLLQIEVADHPEFSGEVTVRKNGTFSIPSLARTHNKPIYALEIDLPQITQAVQNTLTPYIFGAPSVQVTLKESRSKFFYVMGEVGREGRYRMGEKRITLRRALLAARLFRRGANRASVHVITPDATNPIFVTINAHDILTGRMEDNITLKPNQIVFVKPTMYALVFSMIQELTDRTSDLQDGDSTFDVWDKSPPLIVN